VAMDVVKGRKVSSRSRTSYHLWLPFSGRNVHTQRDKYKGNVGGVLGLEHTPFQSIV